MYIIITSTELLLYASQYLKSADLCPELISGDLYDQQQQQQCRALVFLSSTLYALCIETKINFVNQNKGKITYNLPMGQGKFSYELAFWFVSIENSGKQKSKNTLRVEINQFCDGKRDTIRSSYTIAKM